MVVSEKLEQPKKKPCRVGRPQMLPTEQKSITFWLSAKDHEQFKAYCSIRGKVMSDLLRGWIGDFLGRHPTVEEAVIHDQLDDWLEGYKRVPGATLEQVLEKFRELQQAEAEESRNERSGSVEDNG